ncbi:ankyrin repeat protein [Dictyocaulus viviparus]|uniref:Ankyrin repeat protein n=1 Tax=Dictyocaulus viviparus TaxID=29172 RepID=A0A0D8XJN8_DICVI|nr:ankyrin repeat protein [Dictyocaulus viviparus]
MAMEWALKYVQHEWLKCAARKNSQFEAVEMLIEQLRELSEELLKVVVNITDQNGNTALHYAVSHGNFLVVSSLLDSGECQLNLANRAGYTAVMLAALSSLDNDVEKVVVQRYQKFSRKEDSNGKDTLDRFWIVIKGNFTGCPTLSITNENPGDVVLSGDVNARATQHGQTALMLSVSHGRKNTTELLIACGADDQEGSTALMCAAEHGHKEIVKLLLSQPGIDASLTDCYSIMSSLVRYATRFVSPEKAAFHLMLHVKYREAVGSGILWLCYSADVLSRIRPTGIAIQNLESNEDHKGSNLLRIEMDSSTALSIAVENGHRDIGVLIYAHSNYNRSDMIEEASTNHIK